AVLLCHDARVAEVAEQQHVRVARVAFEPSDARKETPHASAIVFGRSAQVHATASSSEADTSSARSATGGATSSLQVGPKTELSCARSSSRRCAAATSSGSAAWSTTRLTW